MEFSTDELTQQVGRTASDFAAQYIKPYVSQWDESQEFPHQLFKALGRLGMMGVVVPEAYGGSGLSYTEYVTIIVEIAKVCGGIGLSLAAHNSLCTGHILSFWNEDQKMKYLITTCGMYMLIPLSQNLTKDITKLLKPTR